MSLGSVLALEVFLKVKDPSGTPEARWGSIPAFRGRSYQHLLNWTFGGTSPDFSKNLSLNATCPEFNCTSGLWSSFKRPAEDCGYFTQETHWHPWNCVSEESEPGHRNSPSAPSGWAVSGSFVDLEKHPKFVFRGKSARHCGRFHHVWDCSSGPKVAASILTLW